VHVNRSSLHSLEVPERFEADGSFDVRLINHGEPLHVHLHLDDALSDLASIEAPNHHVDRESERAIRVRVHRPGSVFGKLKIVTSYGAETRYIDVELEEPTEPDEPVQVDESLSKPQPKSSQESTEPARRGTSMAEGRAFPTPVLALSGFAVVLALGVAAVLGGSVAWISALAVCLVVTAAVVLLVVG
jgi:hypothetical protein